VGCRPRTTSSDRSRHGPGAEAPGSVETEERPRRAPSATSPSARNTRRGLRDAILDEIDDVLETNAEDFVKSFIQKGGE
jgi:ubiquitin-like protein Pup